MPERKRMLINDLSCDDCPYYYPEPDMCMYGEPDISHDAKPMCRSLIMTSSPLTNDVFDSIYQKITKQVYETEDSFIFETLSNFARNHYQISVDKDELSKAIQLIRWYRELGVDINTLYDAVSVQLENHRNSYNRGFEDGVKKSEKRILKIINGNIKEG